MNHQRINIDKEKIIFTHKKVCTVCMNTKPINMFGVEKLSVGSTGSRCKQCTRNKSNEWRRANPEKARDADLRKKYGITYKEKTAMLEKQGNKCAACGTTEPGGKYNEWHLDHCHDSKKVRGVLCSDCNLTLGNAKENADRLLALAAYLQEHGYQAEYHVKSVPATLPPHCGNVLRVV